MRQSCRSRTHYTNSQLRCEVQHSATAGRIKTALNPEPTLRRSRHCCCARRFCSARRDITARLSPAERCRCDGCGGWCVSCRAHCQEPQHISRTAQHVQQHVLGAVLQGATGSCQYGCHCWLASMRGGGISSTVMTCGQVKGAIRQPCVVTQRLQQSGSSPVTEPRASCSTASYKHQLLGLQLLLVGVCAQLQHAPPQILSCTIKDRGMRKSLRSAILAHAALFESWVIDGHGPSGDIQRLVISAWQCRGTQCATVQECIPTTKMVNLPKR